VNPPDAVRVWRGYRSPQLELPQFFDRLGSVFIPATVEMQISAGLVAYVPTVTASLAGKPETTPDETALIFWEAQQAYLDSFKTLAVRTYTLTHGEVYTPASRADFPSRYRGSLSPDAPCYLVGQEVDWMHGTIHHLVGARSASHEPEAFLDILAAAVNGFERMRERPLGAIICAGTDYVVYWELAVLGGNPSSIFDALTTASGWCHTFTAAPETLSHGLWDDWGGLDVKAGDSFNMQFNRRVPIARSSV
jgi:hypothetical protein